MRGSLFPGHAVEGILAVGLLLSLLFVAMGESIAFPAPAAHTPVACSGTAVHKTCGSGKHRA